MVERFHRTLADEWANRPPYNSEAERTEALDTWLHTYTYNHHRQHSAVGGPPATRLDNVPGQHI